MDTKRMVTAMTLALAVVVGWQYLITYFYPPAPPAPQQAVETTQPATAPTTGPLAGAVVEAPSSTAPATANAQATPGALHVATVVESPQPATLGSATRDDPQYAMGIALTPYGAGIESVTLNSFRQSRETNAPYVFQLAYNHPDHPPTNPLATRSIIVDGQTFDLGKVAWELEGSSSTSATYVIDIVDGNASPVVRVRKQFELTPRSDDPNSPRGYEVNFRYSFQNVSDRAVSVQTNFNGPTTPPNELERGRDREIVLGNSDEGQISLAHHFVEEFKDEKAQQQLIKSDQPMLWSGAAGAYFAGLILPRPIGGGSGATGDYIMQLNARALNPEAPFDLRDVALEYQTNHLTVEPGATTTLPMEVYFGPKWRHILNTTYYSSAPRHYDKLLIVGSSCSFCTFQWLIDGLVLLLNFFHAITRDWGLAIIALVVLVRLALHPITKRSTINMQKMSKMGPEMERLKKKYGDNKDELNKAMMSMYKEQGFTPILGCLPMFLQTPIWIALWTSLQSTFELRQAPFLWGWTWIDDLAQPDALIDLPTIHLPFGMHLTAINLLPILLGVVFFVQQKFNPQPVTATKEQEQQRKMMQWMSLLFPLFLYNGPSGLNLYILTSTTIGIIESKRIRDHIKQKEEEEKAGKIIVDDDDDDGDDDKLARGKPQRGAKGKQPDAPKRGGLGGWLAELQQRAEEIRKNADKKR
jgi:YidC/Oxa1 family membrane protein insertase